MSAWGKRLIVLVFCVVSAKIASAQYWPKPAKEPNKELVCDTQSCGSSQRGKKLVGYPLPLSTFVGRYADSVTQREIFYPFDTGRAKWLWAAPDRRRIYTVIGSSLFAYDIDTFFTRLAAGEDMVEISQASAMHYDSRYPTGIERVLNNDRMFYPEGDWGSRGGDGPDRLFVIDWDDRGYVYLPCGALGWGITQDPGGTNDHEMQTVYQTPDFGAGTALSVKSGGAYYLLLTDSMEIYRYNVNTPSSPQGGKWTNGPAFEQSAKSSDGSRIALRTAGTIKIYSNDSLVTTANPIATFSNKYTGIATDGTNFYGAGKNSNDFVVITVFTPNGNGGYTATPYTMGFKSDAGDNVQIYMSSESGGYLTVNAAERAYSGASNARLLKIVNGVPQEAPLNGYVALFYGSNSQPAGYTFPDYSRLYGAQVIKRGNKYYFVVSSNSLGDVYELRGSDSITASVKKAGKTQNGNSQAPANSGPFYGDEITFTSAFSGAVAPSVTWDFGDSSLTTITPGTAGAPDVAHQYGGLLAANLPASKTVRATNAGDTSIFDTINVNLARPTARAGVLGTTMLFTGATTNLTLPIVSSDNFFDGSDGFVEGHFSEWRLTSDTASTKTLPNQLFSVGALGERELTFTGHYGPYTGSGATLASTGADAAFSVGPIHYKVRAFAPIVNGPAASGANVQFSNGTRVTTRVADLAGGVNTVVDYKWELLNSSGAVVVGTTTPTSAAISAIPSFSVARSQFAGAQNWKVRLTLTLGNTVETGDSVPLNGPTPGPISKSGCGNVGSPCSLSTPSTVQGNDPATWTYNWTVTGPGTVASSNSPVFTPVFPVSGLYIVTVNVSNALGDAAPLQLNVTVGEPLCASNPSSATTAINYLGRTTRCLDTFTSCSTTEIIDFSFSVTGWTPADCDHYSWNFGDNTAASTAKNPTHTFASAGTYHVTLFIDGGLADATVTRDVKVAVPTSGGGGGGGGTGGGGGGGGGGSTGCPTMVAGFSVSAGYTGQSSGCTAVSGSCTSGETVAFKITTLGYDFSCGVHSISWDFGDGSTPVVTSDGTATINHTFANAGTFPLVLTINNPNPQTVNIFRNVTVVAGNGGGGGGNGGGGGGNGSCSEMTPGLNVSIGLNGPQSGCTAIGGSCAASENIAFSLTTFNYNLSCATHSYEWDFGDSSAKATAAAPTHAYASGGTYTVTLKLSRNGTTATLTRIVTVSGGSSGTGCAEMQPGLNVSVSYNGPTSGCSAVGGTCAANENVAFTLTTFGYTLSCAQHSYEWDFGDSSAKSTAAAPIHAYAAGGTYTVTLKLSRGGQTANLTRVVTVAGSNSCATMTAQNIRILFLGAKSNCTLGGTCQEAEDVNFGILGGYSFSCANHTFEWDFGDGTAKSTAQAPLHSYDKAGEFTVTLKVTNSKQTFTTTEKVKIAPATTKRRSTRH